MSKSYGKRNKGERLVAERLCGYLREATATAPQEGQRLIYQVCAHQTTGLHPDSVSGDLPLLLNLLRIASSRYDTPLGLRTRL